MYRSKTEDQNRALGCCGSIGGFDEQSRPYLLPLWEKVSPKATDEGCSRRHQPLTPMEHPSSVSALRADPPSPTRG
ncbi:hypothetical protein EJ070_32190 [Mesorhizobium sp. M1E.F.Ca.ET.045.02.1.1]|nr:hypothetical protein EJ070_32190 [Mesorhizobium sp. M1E.F.Ca.ET.045.02.1.1]